MNSEKKGFRERKGGDSGKKTSLCEKKKEGHTVMKPERSQESEGGADAWKPKKKVFWKGGCSS